MKKLTVIIIGIFFLVLSVHISGQSVVEVIGHVSNCATDSVLKGATVVHLASGKGAVSGPEGAFSLNLPVGRATLQISFLGYSAIDTSVVVSSGMDSLELCLKENPVLYDEVVVTANERDFTESVRMGDVRISRSDLERLPKFLGEADPIRLLQLTPGVQSSTEGGVGFFVRGGSIDQNLVLYDGATVYNPGHLLGFVSAFNPDIISDVSLIKSGIPAAFGGRLSSVMQVKSDRGRSDSLKVQGQLGLVASRLTLSRSFARNRGSFYASARGATLDLFIKPVVFPLLADVNPFLNQSSYFFYDYNGGVSYRIGERDYLSFSAFYSSDQFSIERSERMAGTRMAWGNLVMSAQWSHLFKDDARLHTSYSRTNYNFDLEGSQSEFVFSLLSSVKDDQFKSTFYKRIGPHRINAGIELTSHTFTPNEIDVSAGGLIMNFLSYNRLYAFEGGIFAEDEIELSSRLSISAGLRYSFFNQVGPYTEYFYDETSLLRDSLHYSEGTSLAFYHQPEPRISLKYTLSSTSSLKASYMHLAQYIHLATSATVSLPTDIWLPSSREIKPQYGDQLSAGYFTTWNDNAFEGSVELYYKRSENQLEFLRGVLTNSIRLSMMDNLAVGKGRAYGAEVFVRKKSGRLTGWTGYTLSRSERIFDAVNEGRIYPAKFDRRHDLSVAAMYDLNDRWNLSAVFVYVSGSAFTLPESRYLIEGNLVNQYGNVNNFRMPPYNRLDLSATKTVSWRNGMVSTLDFSIYNVYNRSNPFYIYFSATGDLDNYRLEVEPVLVSLFPVVPSVSWRFEF